jgi:hypothetical protein
LEVEFRTLTFYIETNLANGFMQRSSSSAAAPILFAKNNDGGLRLSVYYRALNPGTINNWYPIPLMLEMLGRLRVARITTQLVLRNAYRLIRSKVRQEHKTAVRTGYGQFEYQGFPFTLGNALAIL